MPVKPEPPLSSSPAQAGDPNVLLSKETRSFMPRSFIKRSIKVFLKDGLYLGPAVKPREDGEGGCRIKSGMTTGGTLQMMIERRRGGALISFNTSVTVFLPILYNNGTIIYVK
jgi:hypothetical protein